MRIPKLPSALTTVTPFSKYLALILFILLPFIGFILGIQYSNSLVYHKSITSIHIPISEINNSPALFPTVPHPQINLQVKSLLTAFANHTWDSVLPDYHDRLGTANQLLLQSLDEPNPQLLDAIIDEQSRLNTMQIADAPEGRAFYEATTKLCIAQAILLNDLPNIFGYCNRIDPRGSVYWPTSVSISHVANESEIDDILASSQIFPVLLAADASAHPANFDTDTIVSQDQYQYYQSIMEYHRQFLTQWGSQAVTVSPAYADIITYVTQQLADSFAIKHRRIFLDANPQYQTLDTLPPQQLYNFPAPDNGTYFIHTVEGSGVQQTFSADCFLVTTDYQVKNLGRYEYQPTSSYMLTDIKNLDPKTCKLIY